MTSSVSPLGNVTGGTPSQFTTTYTYNGTAQILTNDRADRFDRLGSVRVRVVD